MSLNIVGGVFSEVERAEKALRDLHDLGFTDEDISVFAQDSDQIDHIEKDTDMEVTSDSENRGSKSGKGLGVGALSGGILGGLGGLIAEVALVSIPGIGPLAAAGPIATTLAGLGTGAVGGGIVGALVGAGLPEDQAKEFEEYIKDDNIVVLLKVDDDQKAAVERTLTNSGSLNTNMYSQ